MIQQRARQWDDFGGGERAVDRLAFVAQAPAVPSPIRGQDRGKQLDLWPFKAESGGIGVGERFGDAVGEMPRTTLIVEAHVEEMRAQAQLHHDADMVEQIAPSQANAHTDACKEHFGNRKSVGKGKSGSVSVDLGGARINKKKQK